MLELPFFLRALVPDIELIVAIHIVIENTFRVEMLTVLYLSYWVLFSSQQIHGAGVLPAPHWERAPAELPPAEILEWVSDCKCFPGISHRKSLFTDPMADKDIFQCVHFPVSTNCPPLFDTSHWVRIEMWVEHQKVLSESFRKE